MNHPFPVVIGAAIAVFGSGCASRPPELAFSRADVRRILATTTHPVRSVQQIPHTAVKELARLAGEDQFRIANPGRSFNFFDYGVDDTLPNRQLVFATISDRYFVICYDLGGFAPSRCVVVLALYRDDASPWLVAKWSLKVDNPNLEKLRAAYDRNQLYEYHPTLHEF